MTSVVEMAAAVRRGELSAVAIIEQHLSRIDQDEADIHAFNQMCIRDRYPLAREWPAREWPA